MLVLPTATYRAPDFLAAAARLGVDVVVASNEAGTVSPTILIDEMTLAGASWSQEPQKYHARSLAEIRRKYAAAKGAPGLDAILSESGCLKYLG